MNPLRRMLPEQYQAAHYWDDEAAMRAFLDDVRDLAKVALDEARRLDEVGTRGACALADELHSAAAVVCPGIEEA